MLVDLYRSIEGHDVRSFGIHRFQVGAEGGYWKGRRSSETTFRKTRILRARRAAIGIPCEEYSPG